MNIARLLEDNIKRFGEYDFIWFEEQWCTNVQLNQRANRLGNALRRLGVRPGDRVGVQLPNSLHLIEAFFATFKIGAVVVPVNPSLRAPDLAYIYQDTGMTTLISSVEYVERIKAARQEATDVKNVVMVDDAPEGTLSYRSLTQDSPEELVMADTDNDDLAVLLYTAGTTGRPKGVMLTHYNFYTLVSGYYERVLLDARGICVTGKISTWDPRQGKVVEKEVEVFGVNRKRVSLITLPLFHGYGIFAVNLEFMTGGKLIVLRRWDAEEAMKAIQRFQVTDFRGIPTMYIQMLNHPNADKYDLSSLETCICGAAPMPLEVARKWKEKYGIDIWEGYGLSEATAVNCGNVSERRPPKYGSVGKCYQKCNTIKIFDENGHELPPGKVGEVVIKGPTVMKGYWNKPEETAEALRDGWLYTGDIGYMDEDGYLFLTERKKDLIIRGGENIYPKEVEDVLYKHPQVLEAAVVGVPDPTYGEEVKAFVVLKTPNSVSEQELIDFCKQYLPTYKRPKSIQFMESLPKSDVGKILRRELRKLG
jgi:long-chain acyl-CoA synthetase